MAEHIVGRKTYFIVWVVLMCLTALTFGISFIDLGVWSAVIAVVIAVAKATLIALIFMHMKYANPVTKLVGLASLLWLGIMFVLTSSDFFTRYFGTYPPQ
jgi:cytochrome c oxidase subunit 4